MAENVTLLAVFSDLAPAADAIEQLRILGVHDDCINVISGIPVTEAMLGRPSQWTNVPRLAMGGAGGGMLLGIYLAFQYPVSIPGVSLASFLRTAINARRIAQNPEDKGMPIPEFRKMLKERMDLLRMDHTFAGRYLNEGFSGGEKKRAEILQMAALSPDA